MFSACYRQNGRKFSIIPLETERPAWPHASSVVLCQLGDDVQAELSARKDRVKGAVTIEPFGVNVSANGSSLGEINYAPYNDICP